jgi:hypothetical protein
MCNSKRVTLKRQGYPSLERLSASLLASEKRKLLPLKLTFRLLRSKL